MAEQASPPPAAAAAAAAATVVVTAAGLEAGLREKLQATHVAIEDISGGCGQAFSAIIVSTQFVKKTSLARQRLANAALRAEIAAIHAWTAKCYTPEEWAAKVGEGDKRVGGGGAREGG